MLLAGKWVVAASFVSWWYGMISSIDPLVVLVSEPLALFPLFFFPSLPLFGMAR